MLPLLLAALGAPGAAAFVLQVASFCPLATNSSPVATNASLPVLLALSQLPLLCGDLRGPQLVPCPSAGGPLVALGDIVAQMLRGDPRWGQRLRQRRELCRELAGKEWGPRSAPPQLSIVPERSGPASAPLALVCHAWGFSPAELTLRWLRNGDVLEDAPPPQLSIVPERSGPASAPLALVCHAWGFSPAELTLRWLRNGDIIEDARGQARVLPVGDGTFRTQVTIQVPPGTKDTYECSALHPSLEEPVSVTWAPGLSPRLAPLVALAVLALLLGLLLFTFGLCRYLGPATGYTPLPGDTYTGSI